MADQSMPVVRHQYVPVEKKPTAVAPLPMPRLKAVREPKMDLATEVDGNEKEEDASLL